MHTVPENVGEAIRQGLAELDAGLTRPFDEFDAEFRKDHGIAIDENLDGP